VSRGNRVSIRSVFGAAEGGGSLEELAVRKPPSSGDCDLRPGSFSARRRDGSTRSLESATRCAQDQQIHKQCEWKREREADQGRKGKVKTFLRK
jgi:hypothetical protein